MKAILEDEPIKGMEKVSWWIEYVLRHNGTSHQRYPGADMPWYKYFMLDVISFLFLVFFCIIYTINKCVKFLIGRLRKYLQIKYKHD